MTASQPTVLIVDDDDTLRQILAREFRRTGMRVDALPRGEDVEAAMLERTYDVVLLDMRMAEMDGIATLRKIKHIRPLTEVIMLTGHGSVQNAVQTLKLGAYDFLTKPCDLSHLESAIRNAARARAMRSENLALRRALDRHEGSVELVGRSRGMARVRALVEKVAPTRSTVLIRGESGTGKEVVARLIHDLSPARERQFVTLDCGATEEGLALSELFGHERGAYTGAESRKHGLFEIADSGTLLVDEVGDAPASLQIRLLRVLETGTFRRLGGEDSVHVDVRILAATHRNLEARTRAGSFRQDLYYRLNVITIDVPPLREHLEDVPLLADHFLARLRPGTPTAIEPEAMERLQSYHWPGNVRELRNVIERAMILSEDDTLHATDLPTGVTEASLEAANHDRQAIASLPEMEYRYLSSLIERFDGHRGKVAAALGISERTLYRKLEHRQKLADRQN